MPRNILRLTPRSLAAAAFICVTCACVSTLPAGTKTANLIPVRSPYDGQIVDAEVVAGEFVNLTKILFTVADPRRMWLILNVRQEGNETVVEYAQKQPGRGMMTAQILTEPYDLVAVPKHPGPVRFVTVSR